ncbi:MAG: hypothetical protein F6K00_29995 [Leptolyngbya sp. SIOISBB]|nr:hypothetical protein [Leptolyngbya sp. SIOISBB]
MKSQSLIADTTKTTLAALLRETAQTRKPLTAQQLVTRERGVLRAMLKNGHSHDDIATVLHQEQLTVSGETIAVILAKTSKKKAAKTKQPDISAEATLTITHDQAERITAEWTRLSTVRKGFTRQELVLAMQAEIDAALDAGYTFADIAALLATKGVTIAPSSLQRYHRAGKQPAEPVTVDTDTPSHKAPLPLQVPSPNKTSDMLAEAFDDD